MVPMTTPQPTPEPVRWNFTLDFVETPQSSLWHALLLRVGFVVARDPTTSSRRDAQRSRLLDQEDPAPCFNSYADVGPSRCTFECLAAGVHVDVVGSTATVSTSAAPLQFLGGEVTCQCSPFTLNVDSRLVAMAGTYPSGRDKAEEGAWAAVLHRSVRTGRGHHVGACWDAVSCFGSAVHFLCGQCVRGFESARCISCRCVRHALSRTCSNGFAKQ
eukprot:2408610-Rhodomonas_salina.1